MYYVKARLENVPNNILISRLKYKIIYLNNGEELSATPISSFFKDKTTQKLQIPSNYQAKLELFVDNIKKRTFDLIVMKEGSRSLSSLNFKYVEGVSNKTENNIKDVFIEAGQCAFIIMLNYETISSFLKRIYKFQPTAKEYRLFRINNTHLDVAQSGNLNEKLRPGQIIILTNELLGIDNKEYKNLKKIALEVEQELAINRKNPQFDERFHALQNEIIIEMLESDSLKLLSKMTENDYKASLKNASINYDSNGCVIGSVDIDNYSLPSVNFGYETTNAFLLAAAEIDGYENRYNSLLRLKINSHQLALSRYESLAKLAEQYQRTRNVDMSKNSVELRRFINANQHAINQLGDSLKSKFISIELRRDYASISKMLVNGNGFMSAQHERLKKYASHIKNTVGLSMTLRWGGRIIFGWTLIEAGKSIKAATNKGNPEYTRKIVFVETAKVEAALVGGAAGAFTGRVLYMAVSINPYARAGQVLMTVLGMGGAVGGSLLVDKALYKGMGLCK